MSSSASVATRARPADSVMIPIAGGTFLMGSDRHYAEEAPAHLVAVDSFSIDARPVTNADFAAFVKATGYVTFAEITPDAADYPGALPEMLQPGSLVFTPPGHDVNLGDWSQWWDFRFGADWRHPEGPGSSIKDKADHPVVHVVYDDAMAYAAWAGKTLPTEAEWEFAARAGFEGADYAWGDEFMPGGQPMANTWHGVFPNLNTQVDGFTRTSPVGAFPPNAYGLCDMIGNVWEWTTDFFATRHEAGPTKACCAPRNPRVESDTDSFDPNMAIRIPRRVLKGGSHLCAPNYCQRYRPAARHPQAIDSSTSHVGFRCIRRDAEA